MSPDPDASDHAGAFRLSARTAQFDPLGVSARSFVARGTLAGTRARLIPSTSPTCFFVLAKIDLLAASQLIAEC